MPGFLAWNRAFIHGAALMAIRRRSAMLARWPVFSALVLLLTGTSASSVQAAAYTVEEDQEQIRIETPQLIAVI